MYLRYIQNLNTHQQPQAFISTSTSSSNSSEEQSKLISRSSTLPTLHEDTELLNYDESDNNTGTGRKGTMTMTLTRDALLATERRRLEMRPAGWVSVVLLVDLILIWVLFQIFPFFHILKPHCFLCLFNYFIIHSCMLRVHNVSGSAYTGYQSYIPVSRRDSEIQSLSSGRTDSDTMSLSGVSK